MKKVLVNAAAAAVLTLAVGDTASAKPPSDVRRDRVNAATVQLRELEARDTGHLVTTELGTAEAWLKEAEMSATKRRKRKAFRRHIARVEAMVALVEARLDAEDARALAAEAESEADGLESLVRSTVREADELESRQAELEKEVAR